jgi:hypothetical protein
MDLIIFLILTISHFQPQSISNSLKRASPPPKPNILRSRHLTAPEKFFTFIFPFHLSRKKGSILIMSNTFYIILEKAFTEISSFIFAGSRKHNRQEGRNREAFPRGGELLLCGTLK